MNAQTTYGALRGLVKDSQGAVIAKATVTLTNQETRISRTTVTSGDGVYTFTSLDPGVYTVSVAYTGFKKSETTNINVQTGATNTADMVMSLGGSSETVEVTAAEPLIDTSSANGGQNFSSQQLTDLPNLGRNPFVFEKLDTAVTPVGDPRYVRAEDQTGQSTISVSGAPIGANNFAVDGIPISQSNGGVTFIPSLEAVSDVKVQANTYDAEVGRAGGGLFNTTLKSGTDQYHGVLYGMTRQTNWSANSFFGNRTPLVLNGVQVSAQTPRPDVTTYLYAGAFGGPVPFSNKIKYLKNTFFWVVEEGYRQAQPLVGTGSYVMPSPAELKGDFSGDLTTVNSAGATIPGSVLYDPTTSPRVPLMGLKNGISTPNVIPASYINPIGNYIASVFPACTLCTAAYGTANYSATDDFKTRSDMYSGKLDHVFTPWWSGAVSYVHLATQEPSGSFIHTFANADGILHRFNDATALNNVFTLNPTTVLTAGFGFNRYYSHQVPYAESSFSGGGFNQGTGFGGSGFPAAYVALVQSKSFPSIFVNGIGPTGANNIASTSTSTAGLGASDTGATIQFSRNIVVGLSKTVGKQDLKIGYVYRSLNNFQPQRGTSGSFTFDGQGTTSSGASISNAVNTGNALADLLLGIPSNGSTSAESLTLVGPKSFDQNVRYHALFFQDNFRASEKLTFTMGIRYEYELGQRETQNQYAVGFDPNVSYSFPCTLTTGVSNCATAHGGLAFAGQGKYPTRCCNMPGKFSPRVGVAYAVRKGTVLRGGFGIYYAPVALVVNNPGYSQITGSAPTGNITTATTVGTTAPLSNPFGGAGNVLAPSGNTFGALTSLGSSISAQDFNRKYPLVEQYSLGVEHELPWRMSINVGYIGAHSKYFPQNVSINQLPDGLMSQFQANGTNNNVSVANPYYAPTISAGGTTLPTTGVVSKTTITQGQLLLPYPQFPGGSGLVLIESVGYSLYNALAVKVQKQYGNGLSVLAAYTWSSNWDNFYAAASGFTSSLNSTSGPQNYHNPKGEYARAVNNIPNRATFGVTYALPVGRGKPFLGNAPRLVDEFIGGWDINLVSIIQNGSPLSFTQTNTSANFGVAGFGGNTMRPTLIPGVNPCRSGTPESRLSNYFNPAAFASTPALTYSSMPRAISCQGPGYANSDLSVNKKFSVGERVKIEFRAEALNVTNSSEFNNPGTSLTVAQSSLATAPSAPTLSSSTNVILGTAGFARTIQMGGRISF